MAFTPGKLEAIGYDRDGRRVATTAVETPGTPTQLRLSYFESGVPASRNDLLIVYATMLDKQGNPCHTNDVHISLVADGGPIMGPSTFKTQDGVASFIVQTDNSKVLRLTASGKNLKQDVMTLKLK